MGVHRAAAVSAAGWRGEGGGGGQRGSPDPGGPLLPQSESRLCVLPEELTFPSSAALSGETWADNTGAIQKIGDFLKRNLRVQRRGEFCPLKKNIKTCVFKKVDGL